MTDSELSDKIEMLVYGLLSPGEEAALWEQRRQAEQLVAGKPAGDFAQRFDAALSAARRRRDLLLLGWPVPTVTSASPPGGSLSAGERVRHLEKLLLEREVLAKPEAFAKPDVLKSRPARPASPVHATGLSTSGVTPACVTPACVTPPVNSANAKSVNITLAPPVRFWWLSAAGAVAAAAVLAACVWAYRQLQLEPTAPLLAYVETPELLPEQGSALIRVGLCRPAGGEVECGSAAEDAEPRLAVVGGQVRVQLVSDDPGHEIPEGGEPPSQSAEAITGSDGWAWVRVPTTGLPTGAYRLVVEGRAATGSSGLSMTGGGSTGAMTAVGLSTCLGENLASAGDAPLLEDLAGNASRCRLEQPVRIVRAYRVWVQTDKPAYRAGELLRVRSVVLNASTGRPAVGQTVEFRLLDRDGRPLNPRGSHRLPTVLATTDRYGLAAAEIRLPRGSTEELGRTDRSTAASDRSAREASAREASPSELGEVSVAAAVLDEQRRTAAQADTPIYVGPYQLPTTRVEITLSQSWWHPRQPVTGQVAVTDRAGRPLVGAEIDLWLGEPGRPRAGRTGREGGSRLLLRTLADGRVPFAVLYEGAVDTLQRLVLCAEVQPPKPREPMAREEPTGPNDAKLNEPAPTPATRAVVVTISPTPMLVRLIPESRRPVLGVPTRVWAVVISPDGRPLTGVKLRVDPGNLPGATEGALPQSAVAFTDSTGIAELSWIPQRVEPGTESRPAQPLPVLVATTADGTETRWPWQPWSQPGFSQPGLLGSGQASGNPRRGPSDPSGSRVPVSSASGSANLLLQPTRTVLTVGDPLELNVLTSEDTTNATSVLVEAFAVGSSGHPRLGFRVAATVLQPRNGHGHARLELPPELVGPVLLVARRVNAHSPADLDQKLIIVTPRGALSLTANWERAHYAVGETARLELIVRESVAHEPRSSPGRPTGRPVAAGVGLNISEAALAEVRPMADSLMSSAVPWEAQLREPQLWEALVSVSALPGEPNPSRDAARALLLTETLTRAGWDAELDLRDRPRGSALVSPTIRAFVGANNGTHISLAGSWADSTATRDYEHRLRRYLWMRPLLLSAFLSCLLLFLLVGRLLGPNRRTAVGVLMLTASGAGVAFLAAAQGLPTKPLPLAEPSTPAAPDLSREPGTVRALSVSDRRLSAEWEAARLSLGSLIGPVAAPAGDALREPARNAPSGPTGTGTREVLYWLPAGTTDVDGRMVVRTTVLAPQSHWRTRLLAVDESGRMGTLELAGPTVESTARP